MKIELKNNGGKFWQSFGNSYVKGFAFCGDRLLLEKKLFEEVITAIRDNNISQKLQELNGNFSIIISYQNDTYLFADKLKTLSLLYARNEGEWLISDHSKVILDKSANYSLKDDSIMTYLSLGYLHGNNTFLDNCNNVSAGTYVRLNNNAYVHEYHRHIYNKVILNDNEIFRGCIESMEGAFRRMLISVGDRPIWIPLSGGYDSRLLACLCKKYEVKNVCCFTYGVPESYEVTISKQVADTLGFPWYYVEYTKDKFLSIANSPVDDDYIFWGMNLNSTAHFQDFIAFKELREREIIEDDAVIVPGHSGEILGRDQIPYHLLNSSMTVGELLFFRYFQWNKLKRKYKKQTIQNLDNILNSTIVNKDKELAIDLFSNWNIKNRQANFIVNAVRVYEYFGIDWRVPLWDDKLSEFWFSLPWEKNSNLNLYNKFLFEEYFIPMNVAIYKKQGLTKSYLSKIRLPFNIKSFIKRELSKIKYFKSLYDFNGFNFRINFYLDKLKKYRLPYIFLKKTNANAVLALYHIFLIEKYRNTKSGHQ